MGSYKGYLKPYEELILAQASEGKGATEIAGMIYEAGARPLWNQQGKKWDVMLPLAAMVAYVIKRNNGPGAQPEMVPPAPPQGGISKPQEDSICPARRDFDIGICRSRGPVWQGVAYCTVVIWRAVGGFYRARRRRG